MAGIYIHVPFCKTRCVYCDFYSTTCSPLQEAYVAALCRELTNRQAYLEGAPIHTIYLGGGTPSQLTPAELEKIFTYIYKVYPVSADAEVTLEANPDDLSTDYLHALTTLPVNRISMGVQTFDDEMLKLLNRRHTAAQAREAVARCRQADIRNISIDLIYGLPGETNTRWQNDLRQAVALEVEHISAYHLTYEEGTPLHRMLQACQVHEVDEESSVRFFSTLTDMLGEAGYEHYEISNFARPGKQSRHNSAYWDGTPYLGCGPSAHSYNGRSRQWNLASLHDYLATPPTELPPHEVEELPTDTRYNEYVMTGLRTAQGISLGQITRLFGASYARYCLRMAQPHLLAKHLELSADSHSSQILRLTRTGIFVSDGIISDLMIV